MHNNNIENDSMEDHIEGSAETITEPEEQEQEPLHFYMIAAVKVLFVRGGANKERTVNVLMDLMVPYVSQQTLNDINKAAAGRVMKENNVKAEDIRGAIIMNISPLGEMTPSTFRSTTQNNISVDEAE